MPRFLFQLVFERVRMGISRQISRFLNAQLATSSARLTIFPRVPLSRALMRLFIRGVDVFLAIVIPDFLPIHSKSSPFSEDFFFLFFGNATRSPSLSAASEG